MSFNQFSGNGGLNEAGILILYRSLEPRRGMGVNLRGLRNVEVPFVYGSEKGRF